MISTLISPHASPSTCTTGWVTITWPIGFLILLLLSLDDPSSFLNTNPLLLILLGIGLANFAGALIAAHATSMIRNLANRSIRTIPRKENHA